MWPRWWLRERLELVDGILVSQQGAWRLTSCTGSASVVSDRKALIKLSEEDIVGTREAISLSHAERDIFVIGNMLRVHDELNQVVLFNVDGENLAGFADADDSVGGQIAN